MKKQVIAISFILCLVLSAQAQTDSLVLNKLYRTWIVPAKGYKPISGVLFEVKDTSVMVSNSRLVTDYARGDFKVSQVDVRKIKSIKIRRVGALGTGMLIGAVSGAVVGIIIGVKQHTNHGTKFDQETQHAGLAVIPLFFTGMGLGIGATIGSFKINIPIKGSQEQFELDKKRLTGYSLIYNTSGKIHPSATFSKLRDAVADVDGNVYREIAIGGQVWMADDLKVRHFRDGSEIPGIVTKAPGSGNLYTWDVATDHRGICPAGWHVPSLAEWTSLYNSLGGEYGASNKLGEGFSVTDQTGQWWTATATDPGNANGFYLDKKTTMVMFTSIAKTTGLSLRCLRD